MKNIYLKKYKNNILFNASKEGWDIYKKSDNIFFLIKKKDKNEIFDLESDIILLHKGPFNIEKQNNNN